MLSHLLSDHYIDCVMVQCNREESEMRDPIATDEHPDELLPYRIVFDDGYYAVRQAWGASHAVERVREDRPTQQISRVTVVR